MKAIGLSLWLLGGPSVNLGKSMGKSYINFKAHCGECWKVPLCQFTRNGLGEIGTRRGEMRREIQIQVTWIASIGSLSCPAERIGARSYGLRVRGEY
jgi:hypothetical protein